MKLKYIITSLIAILAIFTSCSEKYEPLVLDEVQVSSSYVSIPAEGGKTSIKVTAGDSWTITDVPAWLTVSDTLGKAGESTVTFSAEATKKTNSCTVKLNCSGKTQLINVIQVTEKVELPISTCKEVNTGADGITYRIKGAVTKIANTTYGNMYINDGTDEVYIYGTLDAAGAEKNFSSLGIEVGDIVTVEGPRTTYGSDIELKNVTVVKIEKSLIKVDSLSVASMPKEGGEFVAYLTCKGNGVSVEAPVEWLSVKSVVTSNNSAEITFKVAANEGGARNTDLTFVTTSNGKSYTSVTNIVQEGSIVECSIADFAAQPVGDAQFRVTGIVNGADKNGNPYIQDATGSVLVYKMNANGIEWKQGDIITVVGKHAEYKGTPQVGSGTLEAVTPVTTISVADFKNLPDDKTTFYKLTGTIIKSSEENTKYDLETYGNFALQDETGDVYVYGVSTGYNGESKKFGTLGAKEGDIITIIGYKTTYTKNDYALKQVGGAMYVSHTSAE